MQIRQRNTTPEASPAREFVAVKVGVIAGEMERHTTGVGRYLSGLLAGLTRWETGIEWTLFFQGEPFDHPVFNDGRFELRFSRFSGHPVVWEQWVLPRQLRGLEMDLLFAPAYAVPFGVDVPTVVTIHDLSFERFPADYGWRELWRRRLLARRAARVANRVLTVSGHIAAELEETYGVDHRRLGIVPIGIERDFHMLDAGQTAATAGVRPPFLLVAGTVLDRRLPGLTLEAFFDVARERPELQLVFAGANRLRHPGMLQDLVERGGFADRVRLLGWVEDSRLAALYTTADLTLYLSKYEGYGIPPLESLACGTPAVVGPGLALDDVWPDYPYRVAEIERGRVSAVVRRILQRPAEATDVVRSAQPVLERLDWETSSRLLVRELERALDR